MEAVVYENEEYKKELARLEPLWREALDDGVPRMHPGIGKTLKDMILESTDCREKDTQIVYLDRRYSYEEVNEQACRLANGMLEAGFKKGDSLCVMLGDVPELIVAYMACYKIGCIAVGVNPRSTLEETERFVAMSNAQGAVTARRCASKMAVAAKNCGIDFRLAVTVDREAGLPSSMFEGCGDHGNVISWNDWDDFLNRNGVEEPRVEVLPGDTAVLIFTGGTTGVPKACPLTHEKLIWAQYYFHSTLGPVFSSSNEMVSLLTSPMTHAYGLNFGVNWSFVVGGAVVIADSLEPNSIAELIRRNSVTVWAAVPALLNKLNKLGSSVRPALSSLRVVVVSCSISSTEVLDRFAGLSSAAIVEDYGMSETSGPVSLAPVIKGAPKGSVGIPVANTDIVVVDINDRHKVVPCGENGEIAFRGPQVIDAYLDNPEETKKTFNNGWIYSGDVGHFDQDGYLVVVGRIKDIINVGGFNVYPREIDEVLMRHPAVHDSCTIAVPDEKSGERPKSFIVANQGAWVTEQELISYCKDFLIAYKCPKYIDFIESIPLTNMGKPDKLELKRRESLHVEAFERS